MRPYTPIWAPPLLRWAGSKRPLLPALLACVPRIYGSYVEPFLGSGCLFFALKPRRALLGDFNFELIDTYRTIRKHPRRVARAIALKGTRRSDYYAIRAQDPSTLSSIERAARFVYLNRHCFNGVYRTNRENQFNVPIGTRVGALPSERAFYRCSIALRAGQLIDADFRDTVARAKSGDFVYMDPPYSTSTRPNHGEYGYGAFDSGRVEHLVRSLTDLHRRGAYVLLSYSADPVVIDALSKSWSIVQYDVRRRIGGADARRPYAREILASNYVNIKEVTGNILEQVAP